MEQVRSIVAEQICTVVRDQTPSETEDPADLKERKYLRKCRERAAEQCTRYGYRIVHQDTFTFVATPIGLWRFCPVTVGEKYIFSLMHHNFIHDINALDNMSDDDNIFRRELSRHNFHFQHDKREFTDIECLFAYINRHDRSKMLELDDISKMPKNTKNQRKWRRHAENRKRRREIRNVYAIIESLNKAEKVLVRA